MSEAASADKPQPGAGLVGAACAAAQPLVPVPVPSTNTSAMQFFAPDPSDDRDSVSGFVLFFHADCFPIYHWHCSDACNDCVALSAALARDRLDLFL